MIIFQGELITLAENSIKDLSVSLLQVIYFHKSQCLAAGIFHLLTMPATVMPFTQT